MTPYIYLSIGYVIGIVTAVFACFVGEWLKDPEDKQ